MKSSQFFKNSKEGIKILLFNLIFLAIFIELGSLAFYFVKNKQLFYTRSESEPKEAIAQLGIPLDESRLNESIVERLHPFFGYIMKPGLPFYLEFSKAEFKSNNYGFPSAYDYPVIRTNSNQVLVGVFGGSVASNFAIYELENKVLAQTLKQKVPELADKEIIILPLALGGYKQPQQLLILNYFLSIGQEFDIVINIDGFNEMALSNLNHRENIEISMPSVQHILPLRDVASNNLSVDEINLVAKLGTHKKQLKDSLEKLENSKLASGYVLKLLKIQFLANLYKNDLVAFEKLRSEKEENAGQDLLLNIKRVNSPVEDSKAFEEMANLWENSSKLMKETVSLRKGAYFHFIQPNQYYPTNRAFGEAEKKIAILENSPYQEGVLKGYPLLINKVSELQKERVNIFNAIALFDETKETVYIDNCCHYNEGGNEIFANYIAEAIAEALNQDTTFKNRFK